MKSVMIHRFSDVPGPTVERSVFDRSHGFKCTFDSSYWIPIFVDEALPGDTFTVDMTGFARLATPIYPIMDNVWMETAFFSVPNRLLWSKWKNFMGERVSINDTTQYLLPQVGPINNVANGSLFDYLGLPTKIVADYYASALPFRAYNLIYNEWLRAQDLVDPITVNTGDGPDAPGDYVLRLAMKKHDYFTSCQPWPQKGADVLVSLGTSAPVRGIGKHSNVWASIPSHAVYESGQTGTVTYAADSCMHVDNTTDNMLVVKRAGATAYPDIYADLGAAVGPTVNQLRQAMQVQRILERDARAGTRYTEIIKAHFGVSSPDARQQRPEYLGGGRSPVIVTPIANTSNTSTGKLAAMGSCSLRGHGFQASFTEHCTLIGLLVVRGDLTYQQGLDRMWSRRSRYDFYWPGLAHLGEQAVLNREIYLSAADIGDGSYDDVFGYQERFAEYRYKPSRIAGQFRSNDATSLDAWHLSQNFTDTPALNAVFVKESLPMDRVIAVPSEPHFIFDSYFSMKCARPMPVFSVPGMMDHF